MKNLTKKYFIAAFLWLLAMPALLAQTPGTLDNSFIVGTGFDTNQVYSMVLQADGKILVGGEFKSYNGVARNSIARLNTDGTLDNSFTIGTGFGSNYGFVSSMVLQPDGKILIGGLFTNYNGVASDYGIVRLNANGTLDNSFKTTGIGFNSGVTCMALQPNGKIIVGGWFTSYNGVTQNRIARLNANGTLDNSFTVGTGITSIAYPVSSVALQADGKILVGGEFTNYNGVEQNNIARLNADGTLDNSFTTGSGFNNVLGSTSVTCMALQPNGKILVGGGFTNYNGVARNYIARLNADGTLDNSFRTTGTGLNGIVFSIALQDDGKIFVGGGFDIYNGAARKKIARLNADGTLDNSFTTIGTGFSMIGVYNWVYSMVLQADGKILVSGFFTNYNGVSRNGIARLLNCNTPNTPTILASGTTSFCSGNTITLKISNPVANTNYLWSNGATGNSITVNSSGDFSARGVINGCTSLVSNVVQVTVNPTPQIPVISGATSFCSGNTTTLNVSNPAANTNYLWNNGATGNSITVNSVGNFSVKAIDNVSGCESSASGNWSVSEFAPTFPPDTMLMKGESVSLIASGGSIYLWTPAIGLSANNIANPVASPTQTTTYTLTISNGQGCTETRNITVKVVEIFVPNMFSPNGDGQNDVLKVYGNDLAEYELLLFNRLGNEVGRIVQTADLSSWNGEYKGKVLAGETLVWTLSGKSSNGTPFTRKGSVFVMK